jgi:hypothetical protein
MSFHIETDEKFEPAVVLVNSVRDGKPDVGVLDEIRSLREIGPDEHVMVISREDWERESVKLRNSG